MQNYVQKTVLKSAPTMQVLILPNLHLQMIFLSSLLLQINFFSVTFHQMKKDLVVHKNLLQPLMWFQGTPTPPLGGGGFEDTVDTNGRPSLL
jgi:hypothetical protein